MKRRLYVAAASLIVWLSPLHARAFSDSASFTAAPQEGGGGGRYFTGSAADGYTCKVCHSGGQATHLRVLGLPLAGYSIGASYEITIDWPDGVENAAITLEMNDDQGLTAGTIRLPPEKELLPSETCEGTTFSAAQLMTGVNRSVVAMPDCGAKQLRFLWTAPADDRGSVHLSGAFVNSDGREDVLGDGVTEISRIFGSNRDPGSTASKIGGCSATHLGVLGGTAWWSSLLALLVFRRRRRSAT